MAWTAPALVVVWLVGWVGLTLFFATVVGNVKNSRLSKTEDFPTFMFPLFFGWIWPAAVVFCAILAPLGWLSDRATARRRRSNATTGDKPNG